MRIWEEVTGNSWEAGDTRGQASQGRGLRVGAGTPNATSRTSLPELDSWVQVLVPRPLRLQGTSQQGTGGDVSCHLQSSGQLLGGRGHALGGPRKGPLCWPLTWLPWRQSGYSLGAPAATACPELPPLPASSFAATRPQADRASSARFPGGGACELQLRANFPG